VVSGVSAGTATITYTVAGSGGCAAATATRTVTVSTGGATSKCFSATLVGTPVYNATAKTTTFTYDVCAKNCGSGLSHVAFITATNIGVVSPKNGATYKTAKFSYRVTVPVYIDRTTTIWGIKFDVTNKEGIKGTNCDRFVFTMAGNVPVSAITEIQFKAGEQVTTQTSTGGCGGSTTQKMSSAITAVQSTVGPTLEISKLSVSAFPNPYTDKVKFVIQSAVSGHASLEVFNMLGQKVQTVFKGHVEAGRGQSLEYNVPQAIRGNLMYILRVGNQKATGKLIHLN
jgi:hypothetical protein